MHSRIRTSLCILTLCLARGGAGEHTPSICEGLTDVDRRIECCMILGLHEEAFREAFRTWQQAPQDWHARAQYLITAAKSRSLDAYRDHLQAFLGEEPPEELRDHVLEEIAWGVLQRASHEDTIMQRYLALAGQMGTRDVRALPILHRSLEDPSPALRVAAARLVSLCWTIDTTEILERRLCKEPLPDVRVALLQALASCATPQSEKIILRFLESPEAGEQLAAMQAYAQMLGDIDEKNLLRCLGHARGGVRILGALWAHRAATSEVVRTKVIQLLGDPQPDVRRAAWEAVGQIPLTSAERDQCLVRWHQIPREQEGRVRIEAARTMVKWAPEEALQLLHSELKSVNEGLRQIAIEALMTSGARAHDFLEVILHEHEDPLVRLNAGLGLLLHRKATHHLAREISELLESHQERVAPSSGRAEFAIRRSDVTHRPDVPNYPEALDLIARLRLAYALASAGFPLPQQQLESWLMESRWNMSSLSAQLLLAEGGAQAAEAVRNCLHHVNPKIRLQAAMLLATFCSDEEAIELLVQLFPSLSQEEQWQILDASGSIGSRKMLPMLTEALIAPSPASRVIAAASILQILTH